MLRAVYPSPCVFVKVALRTALETPPASPQAHTTAGKTPITVEIDLIKPVGPLGQLWNAERVHGFDELDFGRR
jgi:hypothetical protein